jgi:spermidine synthase
MVSKPAVLPWQTIDGIETREGRLELRQRGERDFLITIGGRVLMTSAAHRSETELARLACAAVAERPRAQLLLGGLGMGYTLRATLDQLPRTARVTVVELTGTVVDWCRGPLAVLSGQALADRRVKTVVRDVSRVISAAPADSYDAIVLDLYEGPHQATNRARDPLYGREALERAFTVLRAGGVLAIWSEEPDRAFESRLEAAGFEVQRHPGGRGGRAHTIYVGTKAAARTARTRPPRPAGSRR